MYHKDREKRKRKRKRLEKNIRILISYMV